MIDLMFLSFNDDEDVPLLELFLLAAVASLRVFPLSLVPALAVLAGGEGGGAGGGGPLKPSGRAFAATRGCRWVVGCCIFLIPHRLRQSSVP